MTVVSPMPATSQRIRSSGSVHNIRVPGIMSSITEIVEEPNPNVVSDTIYVAVANKVKDSQLNLIWAIRNSKGKGICILHVHVSATMIPFMGGKFPPSSLREQEVRAYWEIERQSMHKTLDEYLRICQKMGVRAEKLHIEMDCIEKGIIELISRYNIQELVMGAASNKYHSRKMTDLRSKKAIYVNEQAPTSCCIQFTCKGFLIRTRNRSLDGGKVEVTSPSVQQMARSEAERSPHLRSQCIDLGHNHFVNQTNRNEELFCSIRSSSDRHGRRIVPFSSSVRFSTPQNGLGREVTSDELDEQSRQSPSVFSTCSDDCSVKTVPSPSNLITEGNENVSALTLCNLSRNLCHSSPHSVLDGGMDDTLYDKLEQAMAEAENARQDEYHAIIRRGKAEKDVIDAIRRTKTAEILYKEELKRRKESEEALEKEKEELDNMKGQRDKVKEELQLALDQKSSLESQIASTELMMKELVEKIISDVSLLQTYKNKRDDLQMQRDNALREAEELRKKQGESSNTQLLQFFSEFSFLEIEEATNNFNPTLKIGEGGYGSIFKGTMRNTEVAIKMLRPDSTQGPSEFQHEVDALSKIRHPNIITLIGACTETWTLVYEYLPNGSLEDRLCCKDNSPSLSWQYRIRIAAELCSALIFLHSCKPNSIVHGDLKPSNILLDANLVSKLSDFGMCRILSCHENSVDDTTEFWKTDPKGTFAYMDPEFLTSGELTPRSDVYSFGIILLRMLTGRSAFGIAKEVKYALDNGNLKSLLDPLAGDWPFVQAEQLTRVALSCCEMNGNSRPDLYSDVWRMLESMRASSRGTNTFRLGSQGLNQPPPCFVCPIFQEVMYNPHIAADGFAYEAEAIRGWLDSGHDTSPMTNSKLPHSNLVPNHALRSAIEEWLQSQ
ncbi:hypothetical protein TanjilG_28896 [Lupinus angustifolius]|uniref:RING-type E3 ubiquitin transferase n=1 Tax=Lupinus angustifolius TaxID=3871 RepID=A0A394DH20_LUPAN|nr:PREDICTED: U-box domain-containing protein 33-like isoform X2 [Lupinus angustifolius]OIW19917.1 hypothetical protein TanjilG_28896 [Lupinus angustifolius]